MHQGGALKKRNIKIVALIGNNKVICRYRKLRNRVLSEKFKYALRNPTTKTFDHKDVGTQLVTQPPKECVLGHQFR